MTSHLKNQKKTQSQIASVQDTIVELQTEKQREAVLLKEPKCFNSKGGRAGIDGLQPSVQDRVYCIDAVSTAITTSFMPSILEADEELE